MQGGPRMVAHSSLWGPRGDTCAHDESMRTVWRNKRSQTGRGLRLGFLRRNPPVHLATVRTRALRQGFLGNPSDPHRDGFFLVFSSFSIPISYFCLFSFLKGGFSVQGTCVQFYMSIGTVYLSAVSASQTGRGLRLGFLRRTPLVHLTTVRTGALR